MFDVTCQPALRVGENGRGFAEGLSQDTDVKVDFAVEQLFERCKQRVGILVVFPTGGPHDLQRSGAPYSARRKFTHRGWKDVRFFSNFRDLASWWVIGHLFPDNVQGVQEIILMEGGVKPDLIGRQRCHKIGNAKMEVAGILHLDRIGQLVFMEVGDCREPGDLGRKQAFEFGQV